MERTTNVGSIGLMIVDKWLKEQGFFTIVDTTSSGSKTVEAGSTKGHFLVQVKTATIPNTPDSLSAEEEVTLKARALEIGSAPCEALVQVDYNFQLVGQIEWRALAGAVPTLRVRSS